MVGGASEPSPGSCGIGPPCRRGLRTAIFGIRGLAMGVLAGMHPQGMKGMRNDRRDWGNEEGQQGLLAAWNWVISGWRNRLEIGGRYERL